MLTEIALTPQVFDEASNSDIDRWLGKLDALAGNLVPLAASAPAIVSDMYDGSWGHEIVPIAAAITDHRAKDRVQRILGRLKDLLVPRPAHLGWPQSEKEWADEAAESNGSEPLGRIVVTAGYFPNVASAGQPYKSLDSVDTSSFWDGIRSHRNDIPMDIAAQIDLLRPICAHAHFISIRTPHVRGTASDETAIVGQIIASACRRPGGFPDVEIDLHLDGTTIVDRHREESNFATLVPNIQAGLARHVPTGTTIDCYFWPHFIERMLIAGDIRTVDGTDTRCPRWGLSFTHLARPGGPPSQPTSWNLFSRKDLSTRLPEVDPNSNDILHKGTMTF